MTLQVPGWQIAGYQQGVPALPGAGGAHPGDPHPRRGGQREEAGTGCGLHGRRVTRPGRHHHPLLHASYFDCYGQLQAVSTPPPRVVATL